MEQVLISNLWWKVVNGDEVLKRDYTENYRIAGLHRAQTKVSAVKVAVTDHCLKSM